jgi:uncharacterized OB-fold protein
MLDKIGQSEKMRQVKGTIPIHHRYTVGVAGEQFLRDEQHLLASPCTCCNVALLPPKMHCEQRFLETGENWMEVSGQGRVRSLTVMHKDLDEQFPEKPRMVAVIEWPGIRGGIIHKLGGLSHGDICTGMAVKPVWTEQRTGSPADINHFSPAEG